MALKDRGRVDLEIMGKIQQSFSPRLLSVPCQPTDICCQRKNQVMADGSEEVTETILSTTLILWMEKPKRRKKWNELPKVGGEEHSLIQVPWLSLVTLSTYQTRTTHLWLVALSMYPTSTKAQKASEASLKHLMWWQSLKSPQWGWPPSSN